MKGAPASFFDDLQIRPVAVRFYEDVDADSWWCIVAERPKGKRGLRLVGLRLATAFGQRIMVDHTGRVEARPAAFRTTGLLVDDQERLWQMWELAGRRERAE